MSLVIAGMCQRDVLDRLNVSRRTLHRYRQSPDWPGDDADIDTIERWVGARRPLSVNVNTSKKTTRPEQPKRKRRRSPRSNQPPKPHSRESTAAEPATDEEWDDSMSLDEEYKRTIIERNKAQIRDYQLKCMAEYRAEMVARMNRALDVIVRGLADLSCEQIELVRGLVQSAREVINE